MMIEIFDRVEILNTELQKSDLCVLECREKIRAVTEVLSASRDTKFENIWQKTVQGVKELEIDEPEIPRLRKIPKRLDSGASGHQFKTPKDFFKKQFCEVFDQLIVSLKSRFDNDSAKYFEKLERFAVGDCEDADFIVDFYKDFNKERLLCDKRLFFQLVKRQNLEVRSLGDIVNFFKKYEWCRGLVPDFLRFIKLLVTTPGSSCSNERSFSVLRRLKSYLRATMLQERLNNIAIIHVYRTMSENLNINQLMNDFIKNNSKRSNVFALCE